MLDDAAPRKGVQRVGVAVHPGLVEEHRLRHRSREGLGQVPGGQEPGSPPARAAGEWV